MEIIDALPMLSYQCRRQMRNSGETNHSNTRVVASGPFANMGGAERPVRLRGGGMTPTEIKRSAASAPCGLSRQQKPPGPSREAWRSLAKPALIVPKLGSGAQSLYLALLAASETACTFCWLSFFASSANLRLSSITFCASPFMRSPSSLATSCWPWT